MPDLPCSHQSDLAWERYGSGPACVVFLHGFGAGRATWHDLLPYLPTHCHYYLLDLKGHGESPKPRDDRYGIAAQARAVIAFLERQQCRKVTLVGHSLGGAVALMVAISLQETDLLQRLVIIAGACYPQPLPRFMRYLRYPGAESLLAIIPPGLLVRRTLQSIISRPERITPALTARYLSFLAPQGIRYALVTTVRQLLITDYGKAIEHYHNLLLPTLIIWGESDRIIWPALGKRLAQELPRATFKLIADCGHTPQEEAPAQVGLLLTDFLSSQ